MAPCNCTLLNYASSNGDYGYHPLTCVNAPHASNSLLEPIILEETALDLTALDPPAPPDELEVDEVIDLSGPMDLSSSQHHGVWETEPGFSFTGLLAVEEDSNDLLFRETENVLDLRRAS